MLHIMERNRRIKVNIISLDSTGIVLVFIYFFMFWPLSLHYKNNNEYRRNSSDVCLHLYITLVRTLALYSSLYLFQIYRYSVKLTSVKTFLVSLYFPSEVF